MDNDMSQESFNKILSENESLYNLITEKKLNTFAKLPPKENFDADFIDWLSPQYYDAFTSIYNTYYTIENKSTLINVIRSPWFCNTETEEKIIEFLKPHMENSVQLSDKLKTDFDNTKSTETLVELTNSLDEKVFNYLNKALFTKKNTKIEVFRETLTNNALSICDILREKRMSKDVKNILISSITESFKNVKLAGNQSETLNKHKSKADSSMTISIVIGALLALFAVIRLLMKLA